MTWRGPQAKLAMRQAAAEGLRAWIEPVFDETQRLVPVDESDPRGGALKESGKVEIDESKLRAAISYSGEHRKADGTSSGPTAIFVHEDMDSQHPGGRQAKYVEQPLMESRATGPAKAAIEIRKRFR